MLFRFGKHFEKAKKRKNQGGEEDEYFDNLYWKYLPQSNGGGDSQKPCKGKRV